MAAANDGKDLLTTTNSSSSHNFEFDLAKHNFGLTETSGGELSSLVLLLLQETSQKFWINLNLDENDEQEEVPQQLSLFRDGNTKWEQLTHNLTEEQWASIPTCLSRLQKSSSDSESECQQPSTSSRNGILSYFSQKLGARLAANKQNPLHSKFEKILECFENIGHHFSIVIQSEDHQHEDQKIVSKSATATAAPNAKTRTLHIFKRRGETNFRRIIPRRKIFDSVENYARALMTDLSTYSLVELLIDSLFQNIKEEDQFEETQVFLKQLNSCSEFQDFLTKLQFFTTAAAAPKPRSGSGPGSNAVQVNDSYDYEPIEIEDEELLYPIKYLSRLNLDQDNGNGDLKTDLVFQLKLNFSQALSLKTRTLILAKKKDYVRSAEQFRDKQLNLREDKAKILQFIRHKQVERANLEDEIEAIQLAKSEGMMSLTLHATSEHEMNSELAQLRAQLAQKAEAILVAEEDVAWKEFQTQMQCIPMTDVTAAHLNMTNFNDSAASAVDTFECILKRLISAFHAYLPPLSSTPRLERRAKRNRAEDKSEILEIIKKFLDRPQFQYNAEDSGILEVRGYYIVLSLILDEIAERRASDKNMREIRIIATHCLDLDQDFICPGLNVLLSAHVVQISPPSPGGSGSGSQSTCTITINTSGTPGAPFPQGKTKAPPLRGIAGGDGRSGAPGAAGQSSGHVVILSTTPVLNSECLVLICRGGDGADGQDGGDGAPGKKGDPGEDSERPEKPGFGSSLKSTLVMEKGGVGQEGKRGGPGGCPGFGGLGGKGGSILIKSGDMQIVQSPDCASAVTTTTTTDPQTRTRFQTQTKDGQNGKLGKGGDGGRDGYYGRDGLDHAWATLSIWFWDSWGTLHVGKLKEHKVENTLFPDGYWIEYLKTEEEVMTEVRRAEGRGAKGKVDAEALESRSRSGLGQCTTTTAVANSPINLEEFGVISPSAQLQLDSTRLQSAKDKMTREQQQLGAQLAQLISSGDSRQENILAVQFKLDELKEKQRALERQSSELDRAQVLDESQLSQIEVSLQHHKMEEDECQKRVRICDAKYARCESMFASFFERIKFQRGFQMRTEAHAQTRRNVELQPHPNPGHDGEGEGDDLSQGQGLTLTSVAAAAAWNEPTNIPRLTLQLQTPPFAPDADAPSDVQYCQTTLAKVAVRKERDALEKCMTKVLAEIGELPTEFRSIVDRLTSSSRSSKKQILGLDYIDYVGQILAQDTLLVWKEGSLFRHFFGTNTLQDIFPDGTNLAIIYHLRTEQLSQDQFQNFEANFYAYACAKVWAKEGNELVGETIQHLLHKQVEAFFIQKCATHLAEKKDIFERFQDLKKGVSKRVQNVRGKIGAVASTVTSVAAGTWASAVSALGGGVTQGLPGPGSSEAEADEPIDALLTIFENADDDPVVAAAAPSENDDLDPEREDFEMVDRDEGEGEGPVSPERSSRAEEDNDEIGPGNGSFSFFEAMATQLVRKAVSLHFEMVQSYDYDRRLSKSLQDFYNLFETRTTATTAEAAYSEEKFWEDYLLETNELLGLKAIICHLQKPYSSDDEDLQQKLPKYLFLIPKLHWELSELKDMCQIAKSAASSASPFSQESIKTLRQVCDQLFEQKFKRPILAKISSIANSSKVRACVQNLDKIVESASADDLVGDVEQKFQVYQDLLAALTHQEDSLPKLNTFISQKKQQFCHVEPALTLTPTFDNAALNFNQSQNWTTLNALINSVFDFIVMVTGARSRSNPNETPHQQHQLNKALDKITFYLKMNTDNSGLEGLLSLSQTFSRLKNFDFELNSNPSAWAWALPRLRRLVSQASAQALASITARIQQNHVNTPKIQNDKDAIAKLIQDTLDSSTSTLVEPHKLPEYFSVSLQRAEIILLTRAKSFKMANLLSQIQAEAGAGNEDFPKKVASLIHSTIEGEKSYYSFAKFISIIKHQDLLAQVKIFNNDPTDFGHFKNLLDFCLDKARWREGEDKVKEIELVLRHLASVASNFIPCPEELLTTTETETQLLHGSETQLLTEQLASLKSKLKPVFSAPEAKAKEILGGPNGIIHALYAQVSGMLENLTGRGTGVNKFVPYLVQEKCGLVKITRATLPKLTQEFAQGFDTLKMSQGQSQESTTSTTPTTSLDPFMIDLSCWNYVTKCADLIFGQSDEAWDAQLVIPKLRQCAFDQLLCQVETCFRRIGGLDNGNFSFSRSSEDFDAILSALRFFARKSAFLTSVAEKKLCCARIAHLCKMSAPNFWKLPAENTKSFISSCEKLVETCGDDDDDDFGRLFVEIANILMNELLDDDGNNFPPRKLQFLKQLSEGLDILYFHDDESEHWRTLEKLKDFQLVQTMCSNSNEDWNERQERQLWSAFTRRSSSLNFGQNFTYDCVPKTTTTTTTSAKSNKKRLVHALGHLSFRAGGSSGTACFLRRLATCIGISKSSHQQLDLDSKQVNQILMACCEHGQDQLFQHANLIVRLFGKTLLLDEREVKAWEVLENVCSEDSSSASALLESVIAIVDPNNWLKKIKSILFEKTRAALLANGSISNNNEEQRQELTKLLKMSRFFAAQVQGQDQELEWFELMNLMAKMLKLFGVKTHQVLTFVLQSICQTELIPLSELKQIVHTRFPQDWIPSILEHLILSRIQEIMGKREDRHHRQIQAENKLLEDLKRSISCLQTQLPPVQTCLTLLGKLLRLEAEKEVKHSLIKMSAIQEILEQIRTEPIDEFLLSELAQAELPYWNLTFRKCNLLRRGYPLRIVSLVQSIETKVDTELIEDFLTIFAKYFQTNWNFLAQVLGKLKSSEWTLDPELIQKLRKKKTKAKLRARPQGPNGNCRVKFYEIFAKHMTSVQKIPLEGPTLVKRIIGDPLNKAIKPLKAQLQQELKDIKDGLHARIRPNQSKPINSWNEADVLIWAKSVKKEARGGAAVAVNKIQALSVFCQALKLFSKDKDKTQNQGHGQGQAQAQVLSLWDTQLAAILMFLNASIPKGGHRHRLDGSNGLLGEIATGEGKTIVAALTAIFWALSGKTVNIITSSATLAEENCTNMSRLFKMFGVSVGNNCDAKARRCGGDLEEKQNRYRNVVIYGTVAHFQSDILLTEVFGKRVTGNRSVDYVLVDEVDSMLLDKGGNMLLISHGISEFVHLRFVFLQIWWLVNQEESQSQSQSQSLPKIVQSVKQSIQQNKLKVPSSLRGFVLRRLTLWVHNAFYVKDLPLDDQYVLGKGVTGDSATNQIVIVDKGTGEAQESTQYSYGVHQFLQLKHGKRLTPESLKAVFMSNLSYFQRYVGKLYGISGTLGSEEDRSLLESCYKVGFFRMPRHQVRNCVEEPGLVLGSELEQMRAIEAEVEAKVLTTTKSSTSRAVLFICENVSTVKKITANLREKFPQMADKIHSYDSSLETNFLAKFKGGVRPGTIIVGTNLAGRGMDLKMSAELERNGGLHVVLTYMPNNSRIEEQAFGRTARAGCCGSTQFIVWDPEPGMTIERLQYQRDIAERTRLQSILAHDLPQNELEESISQNFIALFNQIKTSEPFKHLKSSLRELYLDFLSNRWAIWLDSMQSKIKKLHLIGKEKIEQDFEIFKSDTLELANSSNPASCLAQSCSELVRLAKAQEQSGNLTQAIDLLQIAISKEPVFNETAHYYLATCLLKNDGKNYQARKKAIGHLKKAQFGIKTSIEKLNMLQSLSKICDAGRHIDEDAENSTFGQQVLNEIEILSNHLSRITEGIGQSVGPLTFMNMPKIRDKAESNELFECLLRQPLHQQQGPNQSPPNAILKNFWLSHKLELSGEDVLIFRNKNLQLPPHLKIHEPGIVQVLTTQLKTAARTTTRTLSKDDFADIIITKESCWDKLVKFNFFSKITSETKTYVHFNEQQYLRIQFPPELRHYRTTLGLILKRQHLNLYSNSTLSPLVLGQEDCQFIETRLEEGGVLRAKSYTQGVICPQMRAKMVNAKTKAETWEDFPDELELKQFRRVFRHALEHQEGPRCLGGGAALLWKEEDLPFCWEEHKDPEMEQIFESLLEQGIVKSCKVNYSIAHHFEESGGQIRRIEKSIDQNSERLRQIFIKYHRSAGAGADPNVDDAAAAVVVVVNQMNEEKEFKKYLKNIKKILKESIGSLKTLKNVQVNFTKIESGFCQSRQNSVKQELVDFHQRDFERVASFCVKSPWWTSGPFVVTMLGFAQIALAVTVLVVSGGTLLPVAMVLGSEGLSDLFYAAMNKDNFSWGYFAGHKAFSVGASVLTAGMFSFLPAAGIAGQVGEVVLLESLEEGAKQLAKHFARDFAARASAYSIQKSLTWLRKFIIKNCKSKFLTAFKVDPRFQVQRERLEANLTALYEASYEIGQAERILTKNSIWCIEGKSVFALQLEGAMARVLPQIFETVSNSIQNSGSGGGSGFAALSYLPELINLIRLGSNLKPLLSFTSDCIKTLNSDLEAEIALLDRQRATRVIEPAKSSQEKFQAVANLFTARVEKDIVDGVLEKFQSGLAEPVFNAYFGVKSMEVAEKLVTNTGKFFTQSVNQNQTFARQSVRVGCSSEAGNSASSDSSAAATTRGRHGHGVHIENCGGKRYEEVVSEFGSNVEVYELNGKYYADTNYCDL